jgi:predicted AAA+ superfamily ATPase
VQKVGGWSETVKRLWDEDGGARRSLRVLLLGSSPLLVQQGLTESLAGRFEVLRASHWSFPEMRDAFGWDLVRFLRFGGYPGAAPLAKTPERWRTYVLDALVETTVSRDILMMTRVDKPALLRRLLDLGCAMSAQVLSYQKMLGQLRDVSNTVTLAHYLDLLGSAGMVVGLPKFGGSRVRQRASSPKLLALNTALMTAVSGRTAPVTDVEEEARWRGRLVETAVGAHLVNGAAGTGLEVSYGLDAGREIDFVLRRGDRILAVEVKSGRPRSLPAGLAAFRAAHPRARALLVGSGGVPLDEFLARSPHEWLE